MTETYKIIRDQKYLYNYYSYDVECCQSEIRYKNCILFYKYWGVLKTWTLEKFFIYMIKERINYRYPEDFR